MAPATKSTPVTVELSPAIKRKVAWFMRRSLQSLSAKAGEKTKLICGHSITRAVLQEVPGSSLSWTLNTEPLVMDPSRMLYYKENLDITDLAPSDSGVYSCLVTWGTDATVKQNVTLGVFSLEVETDNPTSYVFDHEPAPMDCHSLTLGRLFPDAMRYWLYNGTSTHALPVTSAANSTIDVISSMRKSMSGVWECQVIQSRTERVWATAWYNLSVQDPPSVAARVFRHIQVNWYTAVIVLTVLLVIFTLLCCFSTYKLSKIEAAAEDKFLDERGGWEDTLMRHNVNGKIDVDSLTPPPSSPVSASSKSGPDEGDGTGRRSGRDDSGDLAGGGGRGGSRGGGGGGGDRGGGRGGKHEHGEEDDDEEIGSPIEWGDVEYANDINITRKEYEEQYREVGVQADGNDFVGEGWENSGVGGGDARTPGFGDEADDMRPGGDDLDDGELETGDNTNGQREGDDNSFNANSDRSRNAKTTTGATQGNEESQPRMAERGDRAQVSPRSRRRGRRERRLARLREAATATHWHENVSPASQEDALSWLQRYSSSSSFKRDRARVSAWQSLGESLAPIWRILAGGAEANQERQVSNIAPEDAGLAPASEVTAWSEALTRHQSGFHRTRRTLPYTPSAACGGQDGTVTSFWRGPKQVLQRASPRALTSQPTLRRMVDPPQVGVRYPGGRARIGDVNYNAACFKERTDLPCHADEPDVDTAIPSSVRGITAPPVTGNGLVHARARLVRWFRSQLPGGSDRLTNGRSWSHDNVRYSVLPQNDQPELGAF